MAVDRRSGRWGLAVHEHAPSGETTAAPPVVLVHGTMDRATSLAKVARRLPDLRVIRPDRRGYADSREAPEGGPVPPADTIDAQVDDLLTVLDGRRSVVVGHSMGGTVALVAAARHPELVAAVGAYEPPTPWVDWWPRSSPGSRAAGEAGEDPAAAAERFMRRMIGDAAWERLPASSRATRRAEGAALIADMRAIRGAPPFDPAELAVPVVTACGGDSSDHHARAAEELARAAPDGELVEIAGARHGAHLTHPGEFAAFVRRVVALAG